LSIDECSSKNNKDYEVEFKRFITSFENKEYEMVINKIFAERLSGLNGLWTRLTFKLSLKSNINQHNDKVEEIYYVCNNSLKKNSRLEKIVKAAMGGNIPNGRFNVRETLIGKQVRVIVKREEDERGNVFGVVDRLLC
jgi:hypothetical protein